jgi:Bacterial regulatory proteins, gntR family
MLLSIEPDGPVPIYQQIRDRIVEAIAGGLQPAGSALPSTRQLAVDLGVNFHTVNKSYDILRQEAPNFGNPVACLLYAGIVVVAAGLIVIRAVAGI